MVYNRFAIGVIIQAIIIGLLGAVFFWILTRDYLVVAKFTAGAAWIASIISMIFYVNKTNRSLTNFLQTVKTLDSSRPLSDYKKGSFDLLNLTYNDIIDSIQEVKISKEVDYQYFRSLIENFGTGMIAFDEEGKIETINQSARSILKSGNPVNIKEFDQRIEGFSSLLHQMKPNKNCLSKVIIDDEMISLSIRKVLFVKQTREINLISLQNIRSELEGEEIEVWQKLIHVLTHEIMNSVSPIKSLTGTLISKVGQIQKTETEITTHNPYGDDIVSGLQAIETRSKGLLKFVDSYRNLSKIPSPVFTEIDVNKLLAEISVLMKQESTSNQIELSTRTETEDMKVQGDEKLISQVVINLISNAIHALEDTSAGKIELSAYANDEERVCISLKDNGKGIPADIIDKIFIPFFTTRDGGSGIGLSLSRQIMQQHNGSIRVTSAPGERTEFVLIF